MDKPPAFPTPEKLLEEAARLTLRLALRCDDRYKDVDLEPLNSLYGRIQDLMHAFVLSSEAKTMSENYMLSRFALAVADVIAQVPSLQAAVAANLDDDPYLDDTIDPTLVREAIKSDDSSPRGILP